MTHRDQRPKLAAGVRLKFDRVGGVWLLLAPERGLILNEAAHAVLERCDGSRPLAALIADLASQCSAVAAAEIERDVLDLAQRLQQDGWLSIGA
jgi:pyrroloquinoline quinone biosynthesis protein D